MTQIAFNPHRVIAPQPFMHYGAYNVQSFGAKGDGITDDREAIQACLDKAVLDLPALVWFPPGTYNIENGLFADVQQGDEGLTVMGAGPETSKIVMTGSSSFTRLFALRIEPTDTPTPGTYSQYTKNMTITGLGCYDDDPAAHAAGDQTHGFSIGYCINAEISNCFVDSVGDEAIDMKHIRGGHINDNKTINSPAVGADGAAVTVQQGSVDISIVNNTLYGSSTFGTRSTNGGGTSRGINLEVVTDYPISAIHILGNTIRDFGARGLGASVSGAGDVKDVQIEANSVVNCAAGLEKSGTGANLEGVAIIGNSFTDCDFGIDLGTAAFTYDLTVTANTLKNCDTGGRLNATRVVTGSNILEGCERGWRVFNGNDVQFNNDLFDGCGGTNLEEIEVETATNTSAIGCVSLNSLSTASIFKRLDNVRDCVIKDRAATVSNHEQAIYWCRNVIGCDIEGGMTMLGTRGIIANNNITFDSDATVQTEAGIRLDSGSDDYVISGNNIDLSGCTNNQYCIRIRSGSTGNIAVGNIVKSVTAGSANAVSVEGSGTLVADYTNNNISS